MQLNQNVNIVHKRFQGVNIATLQVFVPSVSHSIISIPHWWLESICVQNVPQPCQGVNFVSMLVNASSVKVGIIWMGQVNCVNCVLSNYKVVSTVHLMEIHANFVTMVITYLWQQTNACYVHPYRQVVKCAIKPHPVSLHVSKQDQHFISKPSVLSINQQYVTLFTVTFVYNLTRLNA